MKKKGWHPIGLRGKKMEEFSDWLNRWADFEKHSITVNNNKITEYGLGYQQAIRDITYRIGLRYK